MVKINGPLPPLPRPSRNSNLANLHPKNVSLSQSTVNSRFLATYLPLRLQNPKAHASISLELVASLANTFLSRSAIVRGEEFIPWDADDIVGVCINLIDQVTLKLMMDLMVGVCERTYCDGEKDFGVPEDGTFWFYED
jgi:hypothetical protein